MTPSDEATAPAAWPPGDRPMAARVRAHDWGATPLGPIDGWPEALRTAVSLCLDAALPMAVMWGPSFTLIPNDALATGRVPALGRAFAQAQPAAWADVAARLERLLQSGEAQTVPHLWRPVDGDDAQASSLPPCFACTPLRDAQGRVAGVLACGLDTVPARETLERLVHELRGPLAPIRTSLELLRMSRDGLEVALVHEMLERQIHAMVGVVDGLLDPATSSGTAPGPTLPALLTPVPAAAAAPAALQAASPRPPAEAPAAPRTSAVRPRAPEPEAGRVGWSRRRLAERQFAAVRDQEEDDELMLDSPPIARKVLVVDDHHDAADSIALLLGHLGAEVHVAYGGEQALLALEDWVPEAVLLDLEMPEMDGFEVARRIRAMPRLAGLPLIALSGLGQGTDFQRTRAAGIDHHLVKPVRLDVLVEVLASLDGLGEDLEDETRH